MTREHHEGKGWRFTPDEYGFDELVVDDVSSIHIERMDRDHVWMAIYTKDGERHDVNFTTKRGAILGGFEHDQ